MAEIFFRPRAIRGFNSAPKFEREKIKSVILILRNGEFPTHSKKLEGTPNGYRIRIGRWRILFVLENGEIDVVDIFIKKGRDDYRRRT